jgi:tetratricopeptide (TPR) repeat protein
MAIRSDLADVYVREKKYSDAETLYAEELAIQRKTLKPDDPKLLLSCVRLGGLYYEDAKYAEAEELFKRAVEISEKAFGDSASS